MTHLSLGWCQWDIPALILLAAIVVVFVVHTVVMKKREKAFKAELAKSAADIGVDGANKK